MMENIISRLVDIATIIYNPLGSIVLTVGKE